MKNSEYNETRKSVHQKDRDTLNLAHLKRDLERTKEKLSKKRRHEVRPGWADKHIERIKKTFDSILTDYWADDSFEARQAMNNFVDWTEDYEGL